MKILWMSDSPTSPSGFGNVSRFVCQGLAARGHHVSILGWQTSGSSVHWQGCTLHPVRLNTFGADVLLGYLQRIQPDVLITLADVWWLTYIANPVISNFMRTAGVPWGLYYPIDGDLGDGKLPPSWVRILKVVDLPIAMSEYGRDVSRINGIEPAYIPHGVELDVFRPAEDKSAAKGKLGYQGLFVVLSDARNQPRKMLPRTLEIFRRFAAGKPDVLLHLHCDPHDPASRTPEYCYDLKSDVAFLGLEGNVRLTKGMDIGKGISLVDLADIYRASDVHLLSSWGEGFGLPTLQAAAAGVVPMASNYTASRELVQGHGEPIAVRYYLRDQFQIRRALIDIDDAVARLERLYRDRERLAAQSAAAHTFAQSYDWAALIGRWDDLLRERVPRLKACAGRRPSSTSRLELSQSGERAALPTLARTVKAALPEVLQGARVTLNVVETKAGELGIDVMRDASATSSRRLVVPVTLSPADPALGKARVPGCVLLASAADGELARRLALIFPGMNAWSSKAFMLAPIAPGGPPVVVKVVPREGDAFLAHLAASVLAVDLGGVDPDLASRAAALAVPCIGRASTPGQLRFWKPLTVAGLVAGERIDEDHLREALRLARWMLTDQGDAQTECERAAHILAKGAGGELIESDPLEAQGAAAEAAARGGA